MVKTPLHKDWDIILVNTLCYLLLCIWNMVVRGFSPGAFSVQLEMLKTVEYRYEVCMGQVLSRYIRKASF